MNNLKFTILIAILAFALYIVHSTLYINPTLAQQASCPAQSLNPRVKEGLISTPIISTNFSNPTGICVVNPLASFASNKIATYADLKSIYFDQAKAGKETLIGDQTGGIDLRADKLYYITGSLALDSPSDITGNQTGIVFVDGNLTIGPIPSNQLTYGNNNSGLVFVVAGNVNIASSVTRIDAILISAGKIYTAGATCSHTSPVTASRLTINGSLISIYKDRPQEQTCTTNTTNCPLIEFCRKLATGNATAAEVIIQQPKYLVILRNLFSDTLQKWSEIQ